MFLKDQHNALVNAQEGVTKAMRQWRFDGIYKIDSKIFKLHIEGTIANQLAGKVLKSALNPEQKKLEIPVELTMAFKSDGLFKKAFQALSPGKQK